MSEIISAYAFAPIGGGGNPLVAWVLAYFSIVNICIDWVLGCFYILIHPYEVEYKGVLINNMVDLESAHPQPTLSQNNTQLFCSAESHNGREQVIAMDNLGGC